MDTLKILAVAPYNGLKDLINEVAKERNDLVVDTVEADMLEGVEVVKALKDKGYDAIISRAGTAELIRTVTDLPVIDIKLSIIDMLMAIKLAQNYVGRFVIVGYKSITDTANIICQMNGDYVEIKTISDISEIQDCLTELKELGVSLIVGDVVTINHAKKLGLNTILVTSGRESVTSAFDEVIKLHKLIRKMEHKNMLMKKIIEDSNVSVITFNENKNVVYSNIPENIDDYHAIFKEIENLSDTLLKKKGFKVLKKFDKSVVNIKGELQTFDDSTYLTFYVENQKSAFKPLDKAIVLKNITDTAHVNFETFFTSSELVRNVIEDAKAYSMTRSPIIIFGEKGTGKDTLAHAIFQHSHLNHNPFIVIDAKYMNEQKWTYLFESEKSEFAGADFTIYIKNLHLMDDAYQGLLESYFLQTKVHKRNRFIFSLIGVQSKLFEQGSFFDFLKNKLNAFPIHMPNLNQRKEDIPSLASLFLGDLILKYGKQVIGLDHHAIKLLQDFQWSNNIDQLKRVMEELIILTDSYYINAETVQKVLANEHTPNFHHALNSIDLNKSLDEINRDIINQVLSEENYNQSKAAERLGISRSTLWRKIK